MNDFKRLDDAFHGGVLAGVLLGLALWAFWEALEGNVIAWVFVVLLALGSHFSFKSWKPTPLSDNTRDWE